MPPLQKSLTLPELHRRRYATANHLPDGHECTEQGDGEPFRLSGLFVLCLDFLDRDTGNMTDEAAERRTPVVHPAFGQQVMGLVVALCRQVLKEGRTTFVTQRKVTVGELAPVDHRRHACAVLTVTKTDMGIVDVLLGRQLKRACLAHLSLQLAVLGVSSPMLVTHGHGRIVLRLEELLLEVDSHDKLHKAIVGKEGVVAALGQGHADVGVRNGRRGMSGIKSSKPYATLSSVLWKKRPSDFSAATSSWSACWSHTACNAISRLSASVAFPLASLSNKDWHLSMSFTLLYCPGCYAGQRRSCQRNKKPAACPAGSRCNARC